MSNVDLARLLHELIVQTTFDKYVQCHQLVVQTTFDKYFNVINWSFELPLTNMFNVINWSFKVPLTYVQCHQCALSFPIYLNCLPTFLKPETWDWIK